MADVAEEIFGSDVAPGTVALHWLCQASFVLRTPDRTVLVDPWLSDWLETESPENPEPAHRARPAPFGPEGLPQADVVLITHEHPDHLDVETVPILARGFPEARWVAPTPILGQLEGLGVARERLLGVQPEERHEVGCSLAVEVLPAAHAFAPGSFGGYTFWQDPDGTHRAVGYLLELDGVRVHFAGDTVAYPGLVERLRDSRPHASVLPINGRDWPREASGLVGNLSGVEAAALARAADLALVVGCHFDGVEGNTADPGPFASAMAAPPARAFRLLADGEALVLSP